MRAVAVVRVLSLAGCSFLLAPKRLKETPAAEQPPDCDTNSVIPMVDLLFGVTASAVGVGALLGDGDGDGDGSRRTELALVGAIGVAYLAGWWFGRKWHRHCQNAKRAYSNR